MFDMCCSYEHVRNQFLKRKPWQVVFTCSEIHDTGSEFRSSEAFIGGPTLVSQKGVSADYDTDSGEDEPPKFDHLFFIIRRMKMH